MASFRQYVQAHDVLQCGGVIAYPTEAVYGYGCDPFNEEAVDRLLSIKRRPWQKGLILIAANTGQVAPLLDPLTQEQREMVESSWPGPVTWLLPDPHHWVPVGIKGQFDSVAVRVTDHPITKQLCERWKGPLVSTSANRTGQPPCYHEWPLRLRLQRAPEDERPDFIVGGATGGRSKPSQIRDLLTGDLVRS